MSQARRALEVAVGDLVAAAERHDRNTGRAFIRDHLIVSTVGWKCQECGGGCAPGDVVCAECGHGQNRRSEPVDSQRNYTAVVIDSEGRTKTIPGGAGNANRGSDHRHISEVLARRKPNGYPSS